MFVDSNLGVEISLKERGQQKKDSLKQRTEAPLHRCIGVSRKFHPKPVSLHRCIGVSRKFHAKPPVFCFGDKKDSF